MIFRIKRTRRDAEAEAETTIEFLGPKILPIDSTSTTDEPPSSSPSPAPASAPAPAQLPPSSSSPPPPNGGLVAWLQVAGAFSLFFNSFGIVNTFGVYQTYYQDTLPSYSASSISWIGTMQGFLLFLVGVIVGPVFDKGYVRTLVAIGTFLVVFGLMMTSLSHEYYQLFLAHGVVVGVGCAFLFLPSMAIVATYFTTNRGLATGITASGGSIGAVIYPIVFHRLIGKIGFGWTTRIIGFIALACLTLSLVVIQRRGERPKQARSLLDMSAFGEMQFNMFSGALFFVFVGLYFPFFYLPTYFKQYLDDDGSMAFYIVAILNAASVFGRITPGLLADRIGPLNAMMPITLVSTILAFVWIGIRNLAGTIVFSVLYGFASGATVSLAPTTVARLTPNLSLVGTRMGMCFTFAGSGLLIGNPIGGALLSLDTHTDHGQAASPIFWKGQLFSAMSLAAGTVLLVLVRLYLWKWRRTDGWKV